MDLPHLPAAHVEAELRAPAAGLKDAVRALRADGREGRVVIVLDQAEELLSPTGANRARSPPARH